LREKSIPHGFINQGVPCMFDSLEEQIKHDDQAEISPRERVMHWVVIAVVSVVVFGGLILGIKMLG
jgi:hypothetical protein